MRASDREIEALAQNVVLVAAYWSSYDRIRRAARDARPEVDAGRAAYQVLALFGPYLDGDARALPRPARRRLSLTENNAWRRNGPQFPHPDKAYAHDAAGLKKAWPRLHESDCEPLPKDAGVLDAWRHYHAGEFADAVAAGRKAGGAGINAAVKAQMIYANYLEKSEQAKLALLEEAAGWADARRREAPKDANAHYLYAYALGRYSQGISITKALAQGFGGKIKDALATALKLEPKHADAHTAFGSYQAEIIDKVGGIVAGMTYGAKKDSALEHYQKALKLNPDSAIARIEYANGLIMLFGKAADGRGREALQGSGRGASPRTRWSGWTSSSRAPSSSKRQGARLTLGALRTARETTPPTRPCRLYRVTASRRRRGRDRLRAATARAASAAGAFRTPGRIAR